MVSLLSLPKNNKEQKQESTKPKTRKNKKHEKQGIKLEMRTSNKIIIIS
jgi:hypothetical protein